MDFFFWQCIDAIKDSPKKRSFGLRFWVIAGQYSGVRKLTSKTAQESLRKEHICYEEGAKIFKNETDKHMMIQRRIGRMSSFKSFVLGTCFLTKYSLSHCNYKTQTACRSKIRFKQENNYFYIIRNGSKKKSLV